jgi:hypothetical protein
MAAPMSVSAARSTRTSTARTRIIGALAVNRSRWDLLPRMRGRVGKASRRRGLPSRRSSVAVLAAKGRAPQATQHVGGLEELPLVVCNLAFHDERGKHGGHKFGFVASSRYVDSAGPPGPAAEPTIA